MKGFVYQLICSKTRLPFYIGSTFNDLEKRLRAHINAAKSGNQQFVYKHIREKGITPEIQIIQEAIVATRLELRRIEKGWIQIYCQIGNKIVNEHYVWKPVIKRPKTVKSPKFRHTTMKIHPDTWDKLEKALEKKKYPSKNNLINTALANELKEKK